MDADRTKAMATKRIKSQHFTASVPPPRYMETRSDADWALLPTWVRSTFFTTKVPQPHPRYAHVMDLVTLPEVKHRIKCMKKNKAGGRSGVTADLLQIRDSGWRFSWNQLTGTLRSSRNSAGWTNPPQAWILPLPWRTAERHTSLLAISNGSPKLNRAPDWLFSSRHNNPRHRKSSGGKGGLTSAGSS